MLFKFYILLFSYSWIQISGEKDEDNLIVQLLKPNGQIRGHVLESAEGRKYYAFQQIPYGKPPVGENRFRSPELHNDWDGILDCTKNTKICYQFPYDINLKQNISESEESEDCLYLNVYTPVKPGSNNNLPVYFFIHGGAYMFGDGTFATLGPKYLIDGTIVIVTMNYRIGLFGFLSTGDSEISGNMGLKDQHLALKWTHKNIHLFGGNPKDIVMGGESSGAFSVGYHMLSARTKGLVSGFMQQSGSHLGVGSFSSEPRKYAFALGKALDPTISNSTSSLVYVLKNATAKDIQKTYNSVLRPPPLGFMAGITYEPVVETEDSSEAFITSPMLEETMKGNFNRVPSFIGFNSEESVGFIPFNETVFLRDAVLYDTNLDMLFNPDPNVVNKTMAGEELRRTYTSSSFQEDLAAFIRFTSDIFFTRAPICQAELSSKYVPVYLYQFSAAANVNDKYPGVCHFLDMRYLWEIPVFPLDTTPVNEDVRKIVLKLWWNFIKYKNPTPERDPLLQNIEWPKVEPENIIYLNLNKTMSIETNPRNYMNLRKVLLKYMKPPFYVF